MISGTSLINQRFLPTETITDEGNCKVYFAQEQTGTKQQAVIMEITPLQNTPVEAVLELIEKNRSITKKISFAEIPACKEIFFENGKVYLVYQHIQGSSLEALYLKQKGMFYAWDVISWIGRAALLLDKLHQVSPPLTHGAITPGKLLVRGLDNIYLLGLGMTELLIHPEPQKHPGFTAPEVYLGCVTPSADIYSLCTVGYYLLTGIHPEQKPPFVFPDAEIMKPEISNEISQILHRGLFFEPGQRYKSGKELADRLESVAYSIIRKSNYSVQFICPNCGVTLNRNQVVCEYCSLDVDLFEGITNPSVYYTLGKQHFDLGFYEVADRYFYQALKLGYTPSDLYLYLARCHKELKHPGSTVEIIRRCIERNPKYLPYALELVEVLTNEGKQEEAEQEMLQLMKVHAGTSRLVLYNVTKLYEAGKFTDAEPILEQLLSNGDEDERIQAATFLAKIYARTGQLSRITKLIGKFSLQNIPTEISFILALYYLQEKNWDLAQAALTTAGKKDRLNWHIYYCLGYVKLQKNEYKKSIPLFLAAARYSPDQSACLRAVVQVFKELKIPAMEKIFLSYLGIPDNNDFVIEDTLQMIISGIK